MGVATFAVSGHWGGLVHIENLSPTVRQCGSRATHLAHRAIRLSVELEPIPALAVERPIWLRL